MSSRSRKLMVRFAAFFAVFALCLASRAQTSFGSITGTVTDASGAVISDVTVTAINLGTNEKRTIKTDDSGNYRLVNLLPAQYRLEFEQKSFKRLVQSPIAVQVDATVRLDVTLQIGATTETVEVTTQVPLLQTESGTLGSQVEGKIVQEMPLNGRNVMNLVALVPGVVPEGGSMGNSSINQASHTNSGGWGNYQIGGAIAGQGSIYLDGAPLNSMSGNLVDFVPTQDSIQEFKVGTNAVSAEFGRFGGGVVELATKSGTNSFHGTLYEYIRNTVLNANVWNPTPSTPLAKQKWNQNQYGFAVGGPVIRDKAFFFVGWENFVSRTTNFQSTNVPDTAMMADANPSVPGNITTKAILPSSQAGCLSYNATMKRTTIATSCLDPTAQLLKNYFKTATAAPGAANYNVLVPLGDNNTETNVRGDINLTPGQRLFVRYTHFMLSDAPLNTMFSNDGWNTANAIQIYPVHQGIVGDTVTINPTTVFDARLSYTRQFLGDMPPNAGSDLSKLGLGSNWAAINQQQNIGEIPWLSFSGTYNFYKFGAINNTDEHYLNSSVLSASLTKIKGPHTLKFGGEARLMDENSLPSLTPGKLTITNSLYAKDEWANFLLGDIANFTFSKAVRTSAFQWYQGYYLTDTWNATRKLNITAGLRWELPGAQAERKDRGTVLLPDVDQVVNGANAHGVLALLNSSLWHDRTTDPARHNLFAPRLGLAYRLNEQTVVRAGYALAYLSNDISAGGNPSSSPVNLATTTAVNPSDSSAVNYTVTNPLGVGTSHEVTIIQPVGRTNPNFMASYANVSPQLQTVTSPVPTSKVSYMQQWNLALGRELKGRQSIEVAYAGAINLHLPPAVGSTGPTGWGLDQLADTYAQQLQAGTITTAQAQALRPYPSYQNLVDSNALNGTMTYDALQIKYLKRVGTGILNSSYTFSKMIGDTDTTFGFMDASLIGYTQNFNNLRAERSILSYSVPHRWVTSYILDLPFGRGKRWANHLNPTVDRIIGGWALNGITTLQTGQPLALNQTANALENNFGAGQIRPNAAPNCSKLTSGSAQSRLGRWFDTSCYTAVGNYSMGNEPRVDSKLHGAGIANWDFTMQKTTRVTESTNLAFRMEFFNIFNRRQFSLPGLNVSSPASFGVITSQQNNPRQIQASLRFSF